MCTFYNGALVHKTVAAKGRGSGFRKVTALGSDASVLLTTGSCHGKLQCMFDL
jgi:hypothetical protein